MGGQNHQPTSRRITAVSAWLSQKFGEGFIEVLQANNHLEDAIMLGMKKLHVEDVTISLCGSTTEHLSLTIAHLRHSIEVLNMIKSGYQKLLNVAACEGYKGNPLSARLEEFELEKQFEGKLIQPSINMNVWQELNQRIQQDNILKTLTWESSEFDKIVQPTISLIRVIEECKKIAEKEGDKAFVDAVENNEVPLRQYYAQVFSLWNNLHAMFLYSALVMTELFYRINGYPSLLEFEPVSQNSQVA